MGERPHSGIDVPGVVGRRDFLRAAAAASAGSAALLAFGCSSSSKDSATATAPAETPGPGVTPAAAGGITPVMLTAEFAVNQPNRFAVGLLDAQRRIVSGADVHLRFFTIAADNSNGSVRAEGDAVFEQLSITGAHAHDRTTGEPPTGDDIGFYVATVPFDQVGSWGVEMQVKPKDGSAGATVQAPFKVLQAFQTPGPGAEPPKSQNDTVATNPNAASLCSRDPACPLHDKVIGDVIGRGRPLVVQFSTPAFCQTRFCGPVLEVVLDQAPGFQDNIDFVHIEVWQDFQLQKRRAAVDEWKLPSEPYTFFIDKTGVVAARIESIFTDKELRGALEKLPDL